MLRVRSKTYLLHCVASSRLSETVDQNSFTGQNTSSSIDAWDEMRGMTSCPIAARYRQIFQYALLSLGSLHCHECLLFCLTVCADCPIDEAFESLSSVLLSRRVGFMAGRAHLQTIHKISHQGLTYCSVDTLGSRYHPSVPVIRVRECLSRYPNRCKTIYISSARYMSQLRCPIARRPHSDPLISHKSCD